MAWFTPFILPALVGAGTSMISGRNPLEGAAIGAATQGLLGGVDFGGALDTLKGSLPQGVPSAAPSMGGLNLTGAGFPSAVQAATTGGGIVNAVEPVAGSLESAGMVNVGGTYYPEGSIAASGLVENPEIPGQFIDSAAYNRLNQPGLLDTFSSGLESMTPSDYIGVAGLGLQASAMNQQPQMGMQQVPLTPAKEPSLGRPLAVNVASKRRKPVFYG
jgi:hypothetical protein